MTVYTSAFGPTAPAAMPLSAAVVPATAVVAAPAHAAHVAHAVSPAGPALSLRSLSLRAVLLALAAAITGCASSPSRGPDPFEQPAPIPAPPPPPADGAIWHGGNDVALFEDVKARNVGDLLTVILVERTQAQTTATTSTQKDSDLSIANPTLFGRELTSGGNPLLSATLGAERGFEGTGDSRQSNRLDGNLTVTVVERMPNGLLRVQGDKRLRLNQGDESIQLAGYVRTADIAPDNTIPSSRIAQARISYGGRGALGDANAQGWLSRFFNSEWFPW